MRWLRSVIRRVAGNEYRLVLALAAVTVLLGAVLCLRLGNRIQNLDEPEFKELAENVAHLGRYARATPSPTDSNSGLNPPTIVATAYRAPGYTFFLAPLTLIGSGYPILRFANFLLVAVGLVILFRMVRHLHSPLAGLLATIGVLAYPVVLYSATTLYPQTLESFVLLCAVAIIVRTTSADSAVRFALIGFVWGLLVLVVPIFLLVLPLVLAWMFFVLRTHVAKLAIVCAVAAMVVSTWTIRNAVVFHEFVPVATSAGFNLASGNCSAARYNTSLDVRWAEDVYTKLTGKNEVQSNKILTEAGLSWISSHPGQAAWLYIGKFFHWFNYSNSLLSDKAVEGGASKVPIKARDLLLLVAYLPMLGIAIWRCTLAKRRPLSPFESLSLVVYVGAGLAYAIFFTRVRFRLPVDWLLIALDAQFLASLLLNRQDSPQVSSPGNAQ